MNRDWPWEAVAFEDSVRALLERLGGVELARSAERDPRIRAKLGRELDKLGWSELGVCESPDDLFVAAAAARVAGASTAPWPVAAQLAVPRIMRAEIGCLYPVADTVTRLEHVDIVAPVAVFDLRDARVFGIDADAEIQHMPLDPFGVACATGLEITDLVAPETWRSAIDSNLVLSAFYVLGAVEYVVALAADYAVQREQFGQPIAHFGAIQWRLSDLVLAHRGLAELAQYTLWKLTEQSASPVDTLALHLEAVNAAKTILANAHQIFGAVGLTEEHDLAVIDRHLQPLLRRPAGETATSLLLRDAIRLYGFDGLYPVRSRMQPEPAE